MTNLRVKETDYRELINDYLETIDKITVDQIITDKMFFLLDRIVEMESEWRSTNFKPGSQEQSRFQGAYDKMTGRLISYCTAMGMTLASRIRLNIASKKEKVDDLLEKLQKE